MPDVKKELTQIKKDFIDLIESRREERELMIDVISSLNLLAAGQEDISERISRIKEEILPEGEISFEGIKLLSREIKSKLIERERDSGAEELNKIDLLTDRFVDACRLIKKIMVGILEDFYPMSDEMKKTADLIRIECKGDPFEIDIKKPSDELLEFIGKIKIQISKDFSEINSTFVNLLAQVKEVEKTLGNDLGSGEQKIKEIEDFELNINLQMGDITEAFDSYKTIQEIKYVVTGKLDKIKDIVSLKKKEEIEKTKTLQESMNQLNLRINSVEKKAKLYMKAAMKDGLTGLFNRGAFAVKIKEAFENYTSLKKEFSIIVFDVNNFKQINDTLGHIAGDKVLKKIAECLKETFRKDDFIARYGSDEFIVLIDNITEEMADEKIGIFNRNLKKRRFMSRKHGEIKLSVSTGSAKVLENDTIGSIIDRADKAMYESKQKTAGSANNIING